MILPLALKFTITSIFQYQKIIDRGDVIYAATPFFVPFWFGGP